MELDGAVAIVTGGGRGLGRAIAEAYVVRGAKVALADVLADELRAAVSDIRKTGGVAIGIPTDVTIPSDVEAMARRVTDELGAVDILVNCAGTLTGIGPVREVDGDRWLRDVMVSLYGSFLCCRAILKPMIERRAGYILNMFGGGKEPQRHMSGYVSAKAGLLLLTEGLAKEMRDYGVKVFAMRPGPVRTGLNEALISGPEGEKWRPDFKRIFSEGRDASPDLVVNLAVALVGGKADSLTGRLFDAERGFDNIVRDAAAILKRDLLTLRVRE